MRKPLIVATIAIAAGGFASPWIMGSIAEDQFSQTISLLKESEDTYMSIAESDFDRGYANSHARIKFAYTFPEDELPPFSVIVESKLQHTPLSSNDQGTYIFEITSEDKILLEDIPADVKAFIDEHLGGYLLTGNSHMSLFGNGGTTLSTQAVNFEDAMNQTLVQIDPIVMNFEGNLTASNGTMNFSVPNSIIKTPSAEISINETTLSSDIIAHESGYNTGSSELTVQKINVLSQMGQIDLNNFSIEASTEILDEKLNTIMSYNIESISAPFPFTSARYDIEFNGLSLEAMALLDELNQQSAEFVPTALESEKFIIDIANATLQPGLQFSQALNVNAFGGNWFADVDLEFTGIEGIELQQLINPELAPKAISADIKVEIDSTAIMQTPAAPMVSPYLNQGLIKQTNEKLVSEIKLSNGKLMVNQQEFPIEPLIESLLMKMSELPTH